MTASRVAAGAATTNGHVAFVTPAAVRQPAKALGPRAQRTIARIIDATRDVFQSHGYSGTTVDEITRIADVSRASFYTYFPSKREVLLAVGANSARESLAAIDRLPAMGATRTGLAQWVGEFFDLLDVHGSFSFAWTQAAHEDETIRTNGMKGHLSLCRKLGQHLVETAGRTTDRPVELGLVANSLLERSWNYCQLYADTIQRNAVVEQTTNALWGLARPPTIRSGSPGCRRRCCSRRPRRSRAARGSAPRSRRWRRRPVDR
jgi:AcrR family transcriptional regulator